MAQSTTNFISSTLMGKQQKKKVLQLLQSLYDSSDSVDFRNPVDWKAFNLIDYPTIIKKPMDLGTVKNKLNNNVYQTVQDCLKDIDLIWNNCKLYNKDNTYFIKLAQKMDKTTKKMIKNYLPFVFLQNTAKQKKVAPAAVTAKKQTQKKVPGKPAQPQQPKTYEDRKQNQMDQQQKQQDTPFVRMRKQFLLYVPLCTPQQIGVMFMLIHKNEPQAITYTEQGNADIKAQLLSDKIVTRLVDQMDMWGIGYVSNRKR